MKKTLLLTMLLVSYIIFSQEKMLTKTGTITFDASFPSFEEVKGVNKYVTFVLNPETGEIASLALMKGFEFEIAQMEEHFNENYMETDQFPKTIFRGQIEKFDTKNLTVTPKEYVLKGKLEIHGVTKEINVIAKVNKTGHRITILSNFSVNTSDYNIPIPSLIKYKLASKVNIQLAAVLIND